MKTCRDLTRLARFMTRWLKERGRDGWIVVAQIASFKKKSLDHRGK